MYLNKYKWKATTMDDKKVLRSLLLCVYYVAVLKINPSRAESCLGTGPCTCDFLGWQFDLRPLTEAIAPDQPLFTYVESSDKYEYNPCKPFKATVNNGECAKIKDLALSLSTDDCRVLGEQSTAAFKGDTNDEGGIYIHYQYSNITTNNGIIKNITRISEVHMLCDKTQTFFMKEMARNLVSVTYKFHLLTPYACKPVHHTLSTGSILLILFLLAFIIYLLAGFAFKHFYLGAQGVEIIPHYTFWSDFPLLVKDGCSYTFRCCRGPSAYERI